MRVVTALERMDARLGLIQAVLALLITGVASLVLKAFV